jgi:hypothetical protein
MQVQVKTCRTITVAGKPELPPIKLLRNNVALYQHEATKYRRDYRRWLDQTH